MQQEPLISHAEATQKLGGTPQRAKEKCGSVRKMHSFQCVSSFWCSPVLTGYPCAQRCGLARARQQLVDKCLLLFGSERTFLRHVDSGSQRTIPWDWPLSCLLWDSWVPFLQVLNQSLVIHLTALISHSCSLGVHSQINSKAVSLSSTFWGTEAKTTPSSLLLTVLRVQSHCGFFPPPPPP